MPLRTRRLTTPARHLPNSSPVEPATPEGAGGLDVLAPAPYVRLRLDLAYDGAAFHGWALQRDLRTVQAEVELAVRRVYRLRERAAITVAGRTDTGVHARGQVAHVDLPVAAVTPVEVPLRRFARVLPPDVRVFAVGAAPEGFDARFSALSRRYAYRICDSVAGPDPLRRHEVLWHSRTLDLDRLNEASQRLLGLQDFAAFCRFRAGGSTIRTLQVLRWERDATGLAVARIEADAFCHSMVRSLVGALIPVGEGRQPVTWPSELMAGRTRHQTGQVAPAHGLTLEAVEYPPADGHTARAELTRRPRIER